MASRVLVVTETGDLHAQALAAVLRREFGIPPTLIDLRDFPREPGSYRLGRGSGSRKALAQLELDDVRSVWWRRAHPCDVPRSLNADDDTFRQAECDAFVQGLLWSIPALWVNDPGAQRLASRKLLQLEVAARAGLAVPESLVTNVPEVAASFVESRPGRVIYKRTGVDPGHFTETRLFSPDVLTRLSSIVDSPTTFQDYIEAEADLRIAWIGGEAWVVRIESQTGTGAVDSRLDNSVRFLAYDLPDACRISIDRLMAELRLVFGVIDLRLGSDGEIYFLEVNPQGQFAYMEIKTGLPIFRSLAGLLANA